MKQNNFFKNSATSLSLIGFGTSFGCYQANSNIASALKEIHWYQRYLPLFILALFGIKDAKRVECENDMESLYGLVINAPKRLYSDSTRYNDLRDQVNALSKDLSEKKAALNDMNNSLLQEKEKLNYIRSIAADEYDSDISSKQKFLEESKTKKEENIKKREQTASRLDKEILPEARKIELNIKKTQEEYEAVKKSLCEEVRKSIDSVCNVIKGEIGGDYNVSNISKILERKKSEKDFFTEKELEDVPKGKYDKYEAEYCYIDFYVNELLVSILKGEEVEEERYVEFIKKIVEELCKNYIGEISFGSLCSTESCVVWVKRRNEFLNEVVLPVIFRKGNSSLYVACELYKKIELLRSEESECLNKRDLQKRYLSYWENIVKESEDEIQRLVKDIEELNKKKNEHLEKLESQKAEKPKIEKNIKKLEEDVKKTKTEIDELIAEFVNKKNERLTEYDKMVEQNKKYEEEFNEATEKNNKEIRDLSEKISNKYKNEDWFGDAVRESGVAGYFS